MTLENVTSRQQTQALTYSTLADAALVHAAGVVADSIVAADKANAISFGENWILNSNACINAKWIRIKLDTLGAPTALSKSTQDTLMARFTLQLS